MRKTHLLTIYGEMCPYHNKTYLSSTQTGVTMIQFVLYLRYDMYNKDTTNLYFHVWKHIWIVCHENPKYCIMGTTFCVEDKEHVFPWVEAYMDTLPPKIKILYRGHNGLCRG